MSRSQTFGRETRLRGPKAKLKLSLMKRTGKFDKLTSLIWEVQKKTLYLGLVTMILPLANELEEYLDFGIFYCGDFKHQQYINYDAHLIVEMAEKLGFPNLATQLTEAFKEAASAEIPSKLCNTNAQDISFRLARKSYQKRLSLTFYNLLIHKPRRLVSAIARKFGNLRPSTSMTKDVPAISQPE